MSCSISFLSFPCEPVPNSTAIDIDPERTAVLLIGLPEHPDPIPDSEALRNLARLCIAARDTGLPVLHLPESRTSAPGQEPAQQRPAHAVQRGDTICGSVDALHRLLAERGVRRLIAAGRCHDGAALALLNGLGQAGIDLLLLPDACLAEESAAPQATALGCAALCTADLLARMADLPHHTGAEDL